MATPEQLAALNRLWKIANGHTGQCKTVAQFLLGLYDGHRFSFDLTLFRALDAAIFQDCLAVLVMDYQPSREVHDLLGVPGKQFEQLALDWAVHDMARGNMLRAT